jgi:hypothetical protein
MKTKQEIPTEDRHIVFTDGYTTEWSDGSFVCAEPAYAEPETPKVHKTSDPQIKSSAQDILRNAARLVSSRGADVRGAQLEQ